MTAVVSSSDPIFRYVPARHRTRAEWGALACLMTGSLFAFFWNLTASGYANEFYSAAAQAGSQSWSAFLWGALDAGGAITVDKPPASIWVMALSVRLLGLSSFSILMPQAVMGMVCTYLCYATVRRVWPWQAGIVAGALFATTPVAALMFRFNNPDALLITVQLGAAYCVMRALGYPADRSGDRRRTAWLAVAGLLCGLGFLAKQLQVLLVLPGFALAMLAFSPAPWRRRLLDAAVAIGSMVIAGGWWVLLTVLVPSGARPYIGGSQMDSFIELTFGYNGLGRLTGDEVGSVLPGGGTGAAQGGMWGETGIFRLFGSDFADQFSWLAPLAAAGLLACIAVVHLARSRARGLPGNPGRADLRARLCERSRCLAVFASIFGSWLMVTWVTFSLMAGIFHAYYTVALSVPIAVLAASFAWVAWAADEAWWVRPVTAVLLAAEALWAFALIARSGSYAWLGWLVLACGLAGSALLVTASWRSTSVQRTFAAIGVVLGVFACLVGPLVWTVETVGSGHNGSLPTAGPSNQGDPAGGGGPYLGGGTANDELVSLLVENASGYRWAAATTGSQNAAGYQLASELPVMAIGGFNGSDPAPTLEQFKEYVEQGLIRYYIAGGGVGGSQMGGSNAASEIEAWVAQNFEAQSVGGATVYDLAS